MDNLLLKASVKTAADEQLESRLLAAISELHVPSLRWLTIEVRSGVTTLRGRVRSYHQRQLANLACRRLVGVDHLVDLLTVDGAADDSHSTAIHPRPRRASRRGTTFALLTAALAVTAFSGCGDDSRLPVVAVKGSLSYEGRAIPGALVVLHPSAAGEAAAVRPLGHVAPDGTFELSTYDERDGAPVGDYVVTVEWRTPKKVGGEYLPGDNRLPARYSRPETSELKIQIAADVATLPALRLSRR